MWNRIQSLCNSPACPDHWIVDYYGRCSNATHEGLERLIYYKYMAAHVSLLDKLRV